MKCKLNDSLNLQFFLCKPQYSYVALGLKSSGKVVPTPIFVFYLTQNWFDFSKLKPISTWYSASNYTNFCFICSLEEWYKKSFYSFSYEMIATISGIFEINMCKTKL